MVNKECMLTCGKSAQPRSKSAPAGVSSDTSGRWHVTSASETSTDNKITSRWNKYRREASMTTTVPLVRKNNRATKQKTKGENPFIATQITNLYRCALWVAWVSHIATQIVHAVRQHILQCDGRFGLWKASGHFGAQILSHVTHLLLHKLDQERLVFEAHTSVADLQASKSMQLRNRRSCF
jgi:hypothetical protein